MRCHRLPCWRRRTERSDWRPEPVYTDAEWVSNYRSIRSAFPLPEKIAVLRDYLAALLDADGIDHVSASLNAVKEQTFYADTFGSSITQQRARGCCRAWMRLLPSRGGQLRIDADVGSADRPGLKWWLKTIWN